MNEWIGVVLIVKALVLYTLSNAETKGVLLRLISNRNWESLRANTHTTVLFVRSKEKSLDGAVPSPLWNFPIVILIL